MSEFKMLLMKKLQEEINTLEQKPYSNENELELRALNVRLAKITLDLVKEGQFMLEQDPLIIKSLERNIKESEKVLKEAEEIEEDPEFVNAFKKTIDVKKLLLDAMIANNSLKTAEESLKSAIEEEKFSKIIIERKSQIEDEMKTNNEILKGEC